MDKDKAEKDTSELFKAASGPVRLSDVKPYIAEHVGKDMFTDFGFIVRARADTGEDVLLWTSPYYHRAKECIIDADLIQTLFVWGKYSPEDKKRMHEGNFINKGQNLEDYMDPGSLKITEEEDQVIWAIGGREFIGKPPLWQIRGEHAGVRCDLTVKQKGPAFFNFGRFEDLKESGSAGYELHATAEGTIEFQGRTLNVKGYAAHEHMMSVSVEEIPRRLDYMGGRGLNWAHGFGPEFSWYVMSGDVGPMAVGKVTIGDEQIYCNDPKKVWIEEIAHWLDPLSNLHAPYKWRVYLRTPQGELEAFVNAYGRAYYYWLREGGVIITHWYMADCEATLTYPDGRELRSSNQLSMLEHMRTFYREK